jgi:hypothetical protein
MLVDDESENMVNAASRGIMRPVSKCRNRRIQRQIKYLMMLRKLGTKL